MYSTVLQLPVHNKQWHVLISSDGH